MLVDARELGDGSLKFENLVDLTITSRSPPHTFAIGKPIGIRRRPLPYFLLSRVLKP